MCTHTHSRTHARTHTGSRDWNTHKLRVGVGLPSLIPLPCVDFGLCFEIFFFFFTIQFSISYFSVKKNVKSQLRLSSCSQENQSVNLTHNELWIWRCLPGLKHAILVRKKESLWSSSHLLRSLSAKQPQWWTAQSSGHPYCPKTTSCSLNLKDTLTQWLSV